MLISIFNLYIPKKEEEKYMNYISVREASKKCGICDRRIRVLCSEGRVEGVENRTSVIYIQQSVICLYMFHS